MRTRGPVLCIALALGACGTPGPDGGDDGDVLPCEPGTCEVDSLDSADGCAGVYNPDQVLDFHLTMNNWSSVLADADGTTYYPAQFACGDEPALPFEVGVRRKRSGGTDKPGLKIDFDEYAPDGKFYSLKKLSLENGISSGGTEDSGPTDVIHEYMAWRTMQRGGVVASRVAFARVFVNGELIGVYASVEQVGKRFLRARGYDDEGWLFKLSGGVDDGYKTNETTPNPYEERLCFWEMNACDMPASDALATYVPEHLDVDQMLRFGGINALLANSDGPLAKDNNFYFYDDPAGAPRVYMPWDLDTTMKGTPSMFAASANALYTDVLFTHWEDDYAAVLTELLAGPLTMDGVQEELDRIAAVAGAALDGDPFGGAGVTAQAVESLSAWWSARLAQVGDEVGSHAP
jgi:hypothetical protein